jgi:hypothetical protein
VEPGVYVNGIFAEHTIARDGVHFWRLTQGGVINRGPNVETVWGWNFTAEQAVKCVTEP